MFFAPFFDFFAFAIRFAYRSPKTNYSAEAETYFSICTQEKSRQGCDGNKTIKI